MNQEAPATPIPNKATPEGEQRLVLSAFDLRGMAGQGYELQLIHPITGAPLAAYITVLGVDSEAYKSKLREQQRRRTDIMIERKERLQRRVGQKRFQRMTPESLLAEAGPTDEEMEADTIELLASLTTGWRGIFREEAAEEVPFSHAEAVKLYGEFEWIRLQVGQAMQNRENFFRESASR